MSTVETTTTYADFLKEFYVGTVVADLVYKNHPWLGLVPKNSEVRGSVYPKPVKYSNIVGQSALYSEAHANVAPPSRERWELTHIDNFAKATISNKVMELSLGNPAAFREALTDTVDSAYSAFANDVHFELLAKYPYGARAECVTVTGTPTIVLGAGEARFFEKGMIVEKTLDADHTTLIVEQEVVASVDRQADSITLTTDFSTGLAIGDRLYRAGDHNAKADSLPTWLPGSSVGATLFNGVNRTSDKARLAGLTPTKGGGSNPYLNALVLCGAELYTEGSSPDICLLNPIDQAKLAEETEGRAARYAKVSSTSGSLSFSALEVMTGAGAVPVVADPGLAEDSILMGEKSAVELFSAGGLPRMFKKDGSFYHREEAADSMSFYLFAYYNQCIQAPVKWAYSADWA